VVGRPNPRARKVVIEAHRRGGVHRAFVADGIENTARVDL